MRSCEKGPDGRPSPLSGVSIPSLAFDLPILPFLFRIYAPGDPEAWCGQGHFCGDQAIDKMPSLARRMV